LSRNDENSQRRDRVRVALCGRTEGGQRWSEPLVVRTKKFAFKMEPWPAARPDDLKNPGYDVTRFNLAHWRKTDRLLRRARDLGVQVSLIFYVDGRDAGVDPFGHEGMGGPDEQRYYMVTRIIIQPAGAKTAVRPRAMPTRAVVSPGR